MEETADVVEELVSSSDNIDSNSQNNHEEEDVLTQALSQVRMNYNNPDPAQVAGIRSGYTTLMRVIREKRAELVEPDNDKLADLIERSNVLHNQVTRTVDSCLDARFMAASADLGVEKLSKLPDRIRCFTVGDLTALIDRVFKLKGMEKGLLMIGKKAGAQWRGVFGLETMVHLKQAKLEDHEQKRKKPRTTATKSQQEPPTKPIIITTEDLKQMAVKETTDHVVSVYEQLEVLLSDNKSLPLLQACCDPDNFGKSVETLFYVSFLIADSRIGMRIIDDGETAASSCDDNCWIFLPSTKNSNNQQTDTAHRVVTWSMKEWQRVKRVYNVREPLIKL